MQDHSGAASVADSMITRLLDWIRFRRQRGESPGRTLLVHAPRRALRMTTDLGYRAYFATRATRGWSERLQSVTAADARRPYFLIAVPDTLHTVLPCIALARDSVNLVVIGNGLRRWEAEMVRRIAPTILELPAIRGTMIPHGIVLKILVDSVDFDFGLHDPDLFVFRPPLYAELEPRDGEMAVGAYGVTNGKTLLTFPTTHLLALDGRLLHRLCRKYSITPEVYSRTPSRLKTALSQIGIGDHNYPKDYLRFYDAFTLIWAMALSEGNRFRVLATPKSDDILHIGGISYDRTNLRLKYVHARFLTLPISRALSEDYWPRLVGKDMTIGQLANKLARAGGETWIQAIDASAERVASALES